MPSGTYTWNLDLLDVIEEAYELAGKEARAGYDLRTAVRSINLLMREWENKGINLWTVDDYSVTLVASQAEYTLSSEILDVLDVQVRNGSTSNDQTVERISLEEFNHFTDKATATTELPHHYAIERNRGSIVLHLYPMPNATAVTNGNTLQFWAFRKIQDVNRGYDGYVDNVEIPRRFLPALTMGLAYKLLYKILANNPGEVNEATVPLLGLRLRTLKTDYELAFMEAAEEDRDRASVMLVPAMR